MKIYIASKFAFKEKVIAISNELKSEGYTITCEWWNDDIKKIPCSNEEWYIHPDVITIRNRDFKGVDDCDVLILVSSYIEPISFNGANVELGYAIAKNKKIIIAGRVDRNALYSGILFCNGTQHLKNELEKLSMDAHNL